ncbi:MAG: hypothetical protein ACE5JA_03215 [bacterium]
MGRRWAGVLVTVIIICLLLVSVLIVYRRYTVTQLDALGKETKYESPEEGAHALARKRYLDIEMVEIVSARGKYGFDDLEMVVAHVWARALADGRSFGLEDYDNVALFFLELEGGWVYVPEGKAQLVAIGKHLFRL